MVAWWCGIRQTKSRQNKRGKIMFLEFSDIIYSTDQVGKIAKWNAVNKVECFVIVMTDKHDKVINDEFYPDAESRDARYDEIKEKLGA